jgi:ribonuclease-3
MEVAGLDPLRPPVQHHRVTADPAFPTEAAARLGQSLGHDFRDPTLLQRALTHASATGGDRATQERRRDNQRLEFLGDRVLGLVVAELLLERFPNEAEGAVAKRHAALVSRDQLAEVGRAIGLGEHLILGPGERDGGQRKPAILADAMEAVIAALYLDGGLEAARACIDRLWGEAIAAARKPPRDAKSRLQEWAMAHGLALPTYTEVGREGPPHRPVFTVRAAVAGFEPEEATGRSKQAAEQAAAALLLQRAGAQETADAEPGDG